MRRLFLILSAVLFAATVGASKPAREPRPGKPIKTKTNRRDGAKMVYVPPGTFLMGNDGTTLDALEKRFPWRENGRELAEKEAPQHQVTITRGYWIYRTEVTNLMYRKFIEKTGHQAPKYWDDKRVNASNQPVVGVSWQDAVAYCKWAGVRLPTEAEWEYAARGTDGRLFPWGNEAPDATRAVFGNAHILHAQTVGERPAGASPFGALDMAGNVFEWCADWYSPRYTPKGRRVDPQGPPTGVTRVMRDVSCMHLAVDLRVSSRSYLQPHCRDIDVGFRPVRTAK